MNAPSLPHIRRFPAIAMAASVAAFSAFAGEDIELPAPAQTGGKPLMEVLAARKSTRAFDKERDLSPEVLSSLLWAGNGLSRDADHRTAPSAMNCREILLYVVGKTAVYRYSPEENKLVFVKEGDFRAATGMQPFAGEAPLNILLVADSERMGRMDDAARAKYSATDAAFVSANLYLYCASEGLATVVRGAFDPDLIARSIGLPPTQRTILVQTIGYPKP